MEIELYVNDKKFIQEIELDTRLIDLLRDKFNLTGTKEGCGKGECGACTVIMNKKIVNSCLVLAAKANESKIYTIEKLGNKNQLHPIQEAFLETGAVQCGFCTPGFIISTYKLLSDNLNPSEKEIINGLSGNLCRCTGYTKIIEAVKLSATKLRELEVD